jgi:hypothetical protein
MLAQVTRRGRASWMDLTAECEGLRRVNLLLGGLSMLRQDEPPKWAGFHRAPFPD